MAIALRQTEMFCDLTELNRENYKIDLDVSKTTTRTSVSTNAGKGQETKFASVHIIVIYRHGSGIRFRIVTRELVRFSTIADIILRLRALKTERVTKNFLYPKIFSI